MDFWYRGCGWCIRSMPALKQVAEDFKGEPVVLLGMNTDRNEADARFVMDAMKLNYPTMRTTFADADKLKVISWPTLMIIDRDGVVRLYHTGYSPNLRAELNARIRESLGRAGTAPYPRSTVLGAVSTMVCAAFLCKRRRRASLTAAVSA